MIQVKYIQSIIIMFRHSIILSLIIFLTISSIAQEYKDNIMLNATISGSSTKRLDKDPDEEERHPSSGEYIINIKGGYFVTNKSSIGILFGYGWAKETGYDFRDTLETTDKYHSYNIGAFYKGYFKLIKNFYFTLNVSPFYKYSSIKESYPDGEYDEYYFNKENAFYISALPGFSWEINQKFNLEFEVGFFNAYVKSRKILDSPIATEERHQVVYGTNTSLNEFSLHDIKFGITYRF